MSSPHPLDRQIWNALTTHLSPFAHGDGRAVRLDPAFGPFAATLDDSPEAFRALRDLARVSGDFILFTPEPPPLNGGFAVMVAATLDQYVGLDAGENDDPELIPLGADDVADMLALAELTRPGPFRPRTHELGAYWGARIGGRLAAMAGERLRLPGYTEITAVCTHPDFRGRGLAARLMKKVARGVIARGETPFLHVLSQNASAIALYRKLGMTYRRSMAVTYARAG